MVNKEHPVVKNFTRFLSVIVAVATVGSVAGCAIPVGDAKVRHTFEIEVGKTLGKAKNIHYTYGSEFVDEIKPSAIAIGPFISFTASMQVPEFFVVSWNAADGAKHEAKVPVRGKLSGSMEHKSIVFVIMPDWVEGYVGISTPSGEKRERFY
jgi:hypothetical protein